MAFSFSPNRLANAREIIVSKHKEKKKMPRIEERDEHLHNLVMQVVECEDEESQKMMAYSLSENDIFLLAGYLPFNYYQVDMGPLMRIVEYRINGSVSRFLYKQWQYSYDNYQCNKFMLHLEKSSTAFQKAMLRCHLDINTASGLFGGGEKPLEFGRIIKTYSYGEKKTFGEKMAFFSVRSDSKLYHECEFMYYLYCGKEDYLSEDKFKLLNTVKKYDEFIFKRFLINFLLQLSNAELETFIKAYPVNNSLMSYFIKKTGPLGSNSFENYFSEDEGGVKLKYRALLIAQKMWDIFGEDERSGFWKQYRYVNIIEYKEPGKNKTMAVALETDNCYITEFLQKDGENYGRIYYFEKQFFKDKVAFHFRTSKPGELKSFLFQHKDSYPLHHDTHKGEWQSRQRRYIRSKHLTEILI